MHVESIAGSAFATESDITTDPANQRRDADPGTGQLQSLVTSLMAENRELRAELDQMRAERTAMSEVQSRLLEALGSRSPERLVHDLRNVLNERELYRALADSLMK